MATILLVANPGDHAELTAALRGGDEPFEHDLVCEVGDDATLARFVELAPAVVVVAATLDDGDARSLISAMRDAVLPRRVFVVLIGDDDGPIRTALDALGVGVERFVGRPLAAKALRYAVQAGLAATGMALPPPVLEGAPPPELAPVAAPPVAAPPPVAPPPVAPPPRERTFRRPMSVDVEPALIDHCFYRQPLGWPEVSDRYPVAPMTMMLAMMRDAARELVPGQVPIALEDVAAMRWLAVAPAVEVELRCRRTADDAVDVDLIGYARATVRFAAAYPPAPPRRTRPLTAPRPTPITAAELYVGRWMFHGPGYAGVTAMGPMGDDGVDGELTALPAPGALLDCSGQLMGWWVMHRETVDRLAMPIRIGRLAFFDDDPPPGARVGCAVRFTDVNAATVVADHELTRDGRVWCQIDGWEDRRFDSDEPLWRVLQYPEHNGLAEPLAGGVALVREHWRTVASRELVMRRYLGVRERADHDAVDPRGRRAWLLGRIAAKDAVRRHLWERGAGPLYPVELTVDSGGGPPRVTVPGHEVAVSIAHKDDRAVALVGPAGATPGVDLERIEARPPSFVDVAFTAAELALGADAPPAAWQTRLWAAKEAVAKARGTGLTDPRKLACTAVAGDRLTVDGVAVTTHTDDGFVVAWTWLEPA